MQHVRRHFGFVLLALITAVQLAPAQQTQQYEKEIQLIEDFIENQMKIDKIPGLSVGFVKDDFMWTKGFGYADLENKTPATPKSGYRLASNTKSMTAVAILQLVERGKLDLDAEVQEYVPFFPRKKWPVTVRPLLGHLGGISHYQDYDVEGHIKEHKDTRESVAIFADFDLVAEPGTKYNYTSYGYNLLGAVIEGAAKQTYGDFLQENLWGPLGMTDTYMDDPYRILSNRVRGYQLVDGKVKNSEFVDISSRFAAGGTRSTVVDLLKYAQGLNAGKVLSQENIDLMYTSMATKDGHFVNYGMGWAIWPVNGRFRVSHTGGQPETRTILIQLPQENFYIALAYNLEGARLNTYTDRLAQLILDEPWNMQVFTGNRVDDAVYGALSMVFNYGLAHFDRYGKSHTTDADELAEAFRYFNTHVCHDSLLSDFDRANVKINDGRHPVAGEAFVKIGSYMGAKLQERHGSQRTETYHQMGAIGFFDDYLKMCAATSEIPAECRFSEETQETVAEWRQDWDKTYTDYTRQLYITPNSDFKEIKKKLTRLFSGSRIRPDYVPGLSRANRYFCLESAEDKAFEVGRLAVEFYPDSPSAHVLLANTHVWFSKKDRARDLYRKALDLSPGEEVVTAEGLNRSARELMDAGKLDEAADLLEIAVGFFPDEPRLYDSIADVHLLRGKKWFEKALEVDPTYERARERLKEIW